MVLDKLSSSLKETLSKIAKAMFVDEKLIDELVKDIQRALLSSDVNVKLVFGLSKSIKERALKEKTPSGLTQKEYLIKIVYEELVKFMGGEGAKIEITKKPFKIMMAGLFGSGKCVHRDSKIPLSDGEIISAENLYDRYKEKELQIEDGYIIDLESDDLTVPSFNTKTLKVENKKVTRLWKLNGKDLFHVYLDNGNDFGVRVTPEHPFFALREGIVKKIRADELMEDDVVAIPFNLNIDGGEQQLFNEIKELDFDIKYKIDLSKINILREIIPKLKYSRNYCQLTTSLTKGITPISLVNKTNENKISIKSHKGKNFISFPIKLNSELAEFLGYCFGDGHLEPNYIEITSEDKEILDRISLLSNKLFSLNPTFTLDKRTEKTQHARICSTTLVEILNKIFNLPIGKKGKHLRIPKQIQKSSNEIIEKFLRAYFDCDAYSADNTRNIELCSESKEMIIDVSYLLKRFGIVSSISKKVVDGVFYWRLYISGRYSEIYAEKIGFIVPHKKDRSEQYSLIGTIQGCGDQDMIALGSSLKQLRLKLGFTIGEIQKYVTSYGLYEKKGEISRESLSKLVALYYLKKKSNLTLILEYLKDNENKNFSNGFINGFISILKKEEYITESSGQLLLTTKALFLLNTKIDKTLLLEPFKNLIRSDVCWVKVNKIENIDKVDFVYDLTVEDNHSFIADNVVIHNTTSIFKIAKYYTKRGYKVCALGLDVYRPAAMDQLEQGCKQVNVSYFIDKKEKNPLKIYKNFEKEINNFDIIIIDTSGRDALSKDLIKEIGDLNKAIKPNENILVISADIGQAAQSQAKAFHDACGITGVIVTKLDGTAKGGGAISACAVSGAPIKFIGTGEKPDDLEVFNPTGFVSRLLGMGDLEALLEKTKGAVTEEEAKQMSKKLIKGEFNFLDLYDQMEKMGSMGSISKLVDMIPGFGKLSVPKEMLDVQEDKMKKWKHILQSMTKKELEDPETLNAGRVSRISSGAGVDQKDVRDLLKQYRQTKKAMKLMKGMESEQDMNKILKKLKGKLPKGFGM